MAGPKPVLSSFGLQLVLLGNVWFFVLYFLAELAIFLWKANVLPYPDNTWGAEFFLLWLLAAVEATRLFFGIKGNLTERKSPLFLSVLLTIPTIAAAVFLLVLQTYVLRAEVILNAIYLAFQAIELVMSIVAAATFARHEAFQS